MTRACSDKIASRPAVGWAKSPDVTFARGHGARAISPTREVAGRAPLPTLCIKTTGIRSSVAETALRDILHHIELAERFVAGRDWPAFRDDLQAVYAVTRCLEIISEASRRLPEELKARHPSIEWRQMAAAGNVYRHKYEDVAAQYVWDTVQRSLPPLRTVVEQELKRA
jgi:uncharacterized protein with HEPN domain